MSVDLDIDFSITAGEAMGIELESTGRHVPEWCAQVSSSLPIMAGMRFNSRFETYVVHEDVD